jgi:hypothetical protein
MADVNRIGLRALTLVVALAALAAGAPVAATGDCPGMRSCCPMMTGGVSRAATRASCATGASFVPALSCCATEAAPATAPPDAAALAPATTAPSADAPRVDADAGEPLLPAPTEPVAERARAERQHALGLFTLHRALLN